MLHACNLVALVTGSQGVEAGAGPVTWGHVMAVSRAIQPSSREGSQREGQSVNKIPLRKGALLISQQGQLSREGGKGKKRGAEVMCGAWGRIRCRASCEWKQTESRSCAMPYCAIPCYTLSHTQPLPCSQSNSTLWQCWLWH